MSALAESSEAISPARAASNESRDAQALYLAMLSSIVDLSTLAGGRHGYDFDVQVPANDLHAVTQRIIDIEYELEESTGIRFRTYVIPT